MTNYALFDNRDQLSVDLNLTNYLLTIFPYSGKTTHFLGSDQAKLIFNENNIEFSPNCILIINSYSDVYKDRYFVFAGKENCTGFKKRIPLIEKVIKIMSAKLEKVYYQQELEKANNELQKRNKELERYHDLFHGREFRIKELREEVKALKKQLEAIKILKKKSFYSLKHMEFYRMLVSYVFP